MTATPFSEQTAKLVPDNSVSGDKPDVSIIIPAYNAAGSISRCITSCLSQSYSGSVEVVVADNGSTDDTIARARQAGAKCISAPEAKVYGVRNRAVSASSGTILAFTDADCIADKDWLRNGMEGLKSAHIVAGRVAPQPSEQRILYTYDKFVVRATKGQAGIPVNIAAGNALIPRTIFDKVGGFEDDLQTAGDSIFSQKARKSGFEINYVSDAVVYHPVDNFSRRVRCIFREGYGSTLKKPHYYDGASRSAVHKSRLVNAMRRTYNDIRVIVGARHTGQISHIHMIAVLFLSMVFRLLSYAAIFLAKLSPRFTQLLARR